MKGYLGGKKLNFKETVSFEEVLMINLFAQEVLVNLLEKKGIIAKVEFLEEIKTLRDTKNKTKFR